MALVTVSQLQDMRIKEGRNSKWYTGTSAQIAAAGLARLDQLPGAPGRGKTCSTYYAGEPVRKGSFHKRDEQYLSITRCGKSKYTVWVGFSDSQVAEREKVIERQQERFHKAEVYRRAKAEADKELTEMPESCEQYRKERTEFVEIQLDMIVRSMTARGWHGYSYSDESIQATKTLAERVLMVVRNGTISFDADMHNTRIEQIKAQAAAYALDRPALRLVRAVG